MRKDSFERYKKDLSNIPLLTAEEENELALRMRNGDKDAKEKFIRSNLRLVIFFATRLLKKLNRPIDSSFNDLIQAGNEWLFQNVEKFDPSRGYRFSTYAHKGIRGAMLNLLNDERFIKISPDIREEIQELKNAEKILHQKYGKIPETQELAKYMKIKESRIFQLRDWIYKIERLNGNSDALSKEYESRDEEDATLDISLNKENAKKTLDSLTLQEREVIELAFGMFDGEPKGQAEISRKLGVSRTRIHTVEKKTIKKMNKHLEEGNKDKNTSS